MANSGICLSFVFRVYKGDTLVHTETLTQSIVKIGKLPSSHLKIDDESVSRMHAVVEVTGPDDVYILDLGSARGTVVNGKAVNKCRLQTGDEIVLGDVRLVVEFGAAAKAAGPPLAAVVGPPEALALARPMSRAMMHVPRHDETAPPATTDEPVVPESEPLAVPKPFAPELLPFRDEDETTPQDPGVAARAKVMAEDMEIAAEVMAEEFDKPSVWMEEPSAVQPAHAPEPASAVVVTCKHCGNGDISGALYCYSCGNLLGSPPPSTTGEDATNVLSDIDSTTPSLKALVSSSYLRLATRGGELVTPLAAPSLPPASPASDPLIPTPMPEEVALSPSPKQAQPSGSDSLIDEWYKEPPAGGEHGGGATEYSMKVSRHQPVSGWVIVLTATVVACAMAMAVFYFILPRPRYEGQEKTVAAAAISDAAPPVPAPSPAPAPVVAAPRLVAPEAPVASAAPPVASAPALKPCPATARAKEVWGKKKIKCWEDHVDALGPEGARDKCERLFACQEPN